MPLAEDASGTWTSSGTTEADLQAVSAEDGIYQLFVELTDMVAADKLEVRAYEMTIGGGSTDCIDCWRRRGVQGVDHKVFVSPAMQFMHGWKFTLKAAAGGIVAPWSIRQIA